MQHTAIRKKVQALGDEAAAYLKGVLELASKKYRKVIIATHILPFREAAWHRNFPCDACHLPCFTCKAVGDVLLKASGTHPQVQFVTLAGHTHHAAEVKILDNLIVMTGFAEYSQPSVSKMINIE